MRREEWRPVVGYEGLYQVSSLGRVRSLERTVRVAARPGVTYQKAGHILIPSRLRTPHGYLVVGLSDRQSKKRKALVHRLVVAAFLPQPSEMTRIIHRDGNVLNNRADNLAWSNDSILMRQKFADGVWTPASGEQSGAAVLTWKKVNELRRKYLHGEGSMRSLAREYGVAYATARNVIREISWRTDAHSDAHTANPE